MSMDGSTTRDNIPQWLLAELTYTCPLHCPYCSNPVDFAMRNGDLSTQQWIDVFKQARALGANQLGFSGGEPALRKDLESLVKCARDLGFYTNLITSGIGIDKMRLKALKDAGLDNIQISIQAHERNISDLLAGTKSFEHKLELAGEAKRVGLALGINVVLHRRNLDFIEPILKLACSLNPTYIELANTQYYGFAMVNREALLPTQTQLDTAERITTEYQARYKGKIQILYVIPDYYSARPKPCMNGWATVFMTICPDGTVLPCHAARVIKGLEFPNVKEKQLQWIWEKSDAFNKFRGLDWMKEPCRSCPERFKDFGGCRCQAYMLTGAAENTDPVCDLSPQHHLVTEAVGRANKSDASNGTLIYRTPAESKRLT